MSLGGALIDLRKCQEYQPSVLRTKWSVASLLFCMELPNFSVALLQVMSSSCLKKVVVQECGLLGCRMVCHTCSSVFCCHSE